MPQRRSRIIRAFSLIELLVVVSIIGILCAVLVPTLSRARVRAKKVACGATLHGLANTLKTYLSENGERYPAAAELPSVNAPLKALPAALRGDSLAAAPARAWRCPADTDGYTRTSDNLPFASYFDGETLSYEYNMSLGGKRLEQDFLFPMVGATGLFVLADFDTFHGPKGNQAAKNLLFGDGHVGGVDDITQGR